MTRIKDVIAVLICLVTNSVYEFLDEIDYRLCEKDIDSHKIVKNKIRDFMSDVVLFYLMDLIMGLDSMIVYGHYQPENDEKMTNFFNALWGLFGNDEN